MYGRLAGGGGRVCGACFMAGGGWGAMAAFRVVRRDCLQEEDADEMASVECRQRTGILGRKWKVMNNTLKT